MANNNPGRMLGARAPLGLAEGGASLFRAGGPHGTSAPQLGYAPPKAAPPKAAPAPSNWAALQAAAQPQGGAAAPKNSSGASLSSLQSMMSAQSMPTAGPEISAPPAVPIPQDIPVPVAPPAPTEMPPDLAGGQQLSGAYNGRGGIGSRLPPSLAGLLKNKVY